MEFKEILLILINYKLILILRTFSKQIKINSSHIYKKMPCTNNIMNGVRNTKIVVLNVLVPYL